MTFTMRAVHLPAVAEGESPPFTYPDNKGTPEALQYSTNIPRPTIPDHMTTNAYILRVEATALCKGELTWPEPLERERFRPTAGAIPGHDVVGIVDAVQQARQDSPPRFKPGDRVWGLINFDRDGAAADYALAFENEITHVPEPSVQDPDRTSTAALASIPLAGLTAYQALFDKGGLSQHPNASTAETPQRVLITGASGAVGLLAIQLLTWLRTQQRRPIHITAICSTPHVSHLRDTLHCDVVLDYIAPNFHLSAALLRAHGVTEPFGLVIEGAGGQIAYDLIMQDDIVEVPGGRIISISGPLEGGLKTLSGEMAAEVREKLASEGRKGSGFEFFIVEPNVQQLEHLGRLIGEGWVVPVVDEVFGLEKARAAMGRVEGRGRKGRGKVVLMVSVGEA